MDGCNVIPKHLEDVYLNWPFRISCHSLLYHKLDALLNVPHNNKGDNWENPMTTVSITITQISKLQYCRK